MLKKYMLPLALCCLTAGIILYTGLTPAAQSLNLQPVPTESTLLVLPLDSRPPCTDFVSELGALAGTKVILPPKAFLDNYDRQANRELLYGWLQTNLPHTSTAIISTDLLIHGGLIGSRLPLGTQQDKDSFLQIMQHLQLTHPETNFYLYSIIPRLLVADQILPDAWWQWHLMRWAALQDIQNTFDDPESFKELQYYTAEIPLEIRNKYTKLYNQNDTFNHQLIAAGKAANVKAIIIGQDDGQPFGLPNQNRTRAELYIEHENLSPHYATTRGADELGCVLVAAAANANWHYAPKIYIEYSEPRVSDIIMHFMPSSVGETAYEKVRLVGGTTVSTPEAADFILFIHCGDDETTNLPRVADRVKTLLATATPVALVDLSSNYDDTELLFPHLLNNNTPLVRLAAFAGWNTVSNSIGTAVAQASIFTGQKQRLSSSELPALYAQNLKFNLARFLDDWAYQKKLHPFISEILKLRSIDPYHLGYYQPQTATFISKELRLYSRTLTQENLSRFSFYEDQQGAYYLTALDFTVQLPWERIFEIKLTVQPQFGLIATNK
ncbi:MAG: DUF4127 family protein [Acidaminococcaceae bacterium]